MSPAVRRLAERASCDPYFAAHALSAPGLTDDQLCTILHCDADQLACVRLCRCPVSVDEVERIAAKFGVDAAVLAGMCGVPAGD